MPKDKPNRKADPIKGLFHIVEMGAWDADYFNEEHQAFIEFKSGGRGEFHFGYCQGIMDCRQTMKDGNPGVEFSWEGNDEMTQVIGRGWAKLEGDRLTGMIYIHQGEESSFTATRVRKSKST